MNKIKDMIIGLMVWIIGVVVVGSVILTPIMLLSVIMCILGL